MFVRFLTLLAVFVALSLSSSASPKQSSEAFYQRNVFYAGGEYSFVPSSNSTILINQIYVEQLTPLHRKTRKYPVIFVGLPLVYSCDHLSLIKLQGMPLRWFAEERHFITQG